VARKTGPDFVASAKVPGTETETDRNAIRGLPRFLARAGFQIYRLKQQEKEDPVNE
jgi:hypothetical protein